MKYGLFVLGVFLLVAPSAYAGTSLPPTLLFAQASAITTTALGITDSGLLPTNPFYFIKEWGRAIMRATTSGAVPRANLELQFVNEKAAELYQVDAISGVNPNAITTALQNYAGEHGNLQQTLTALPDASQDPSVADVLTTLGTLIPRHERLLDALIQEYSGNSDVTNLISSTKGILERSFLIAATKTAPDQFAQTLQDSLTANLSGELKNTYAAEIVGRLQAAAPQTLSDALIPVYAIFSAQSATEVQTFLATATLEEVTDALRELPDSPERQNVGIRVYEKQKQDLVAPRAAAVRIAPVNISLTDAVLCTTIKSNFDDLWNLFKTNQISAQEYLQKYAILKGQYANCQIPAAEQNSATDTPAQIPVQLPPQIQATTTITAPVFP